ncbi:peptidoglycan binding protein CsiV [Vibrio hannami]|uniref:peptidoglycan binding protein CsiV n=1 Tax=Vibrio hannami TaxID=2717094 RepID=UPI00240F4C82|nr:peptidoglycan binding protein CsiV [Vibrio hannami]MDG3088409.1 peptidoglycan binding protein CsiV [Vibrio hannami]
MKKIIALLLSIVSLSVYASEREFDVEVIIFKRSVEPESVNESWPDELPAIDLSRASVLSNAQYRELKGVQLLPYEDYQLLKEKEALDKHAGFEVLLHTAWRQGDQPKASAPVFHILAGKDYSDSFNPDGSSKHDDIKVTIDSVENETTIDNPLYQLDGKFQVYVQHYLFLETELDLKSPWRREVIVQDEVSEPDASVVLDEANAKSTTDNALPAVEPVNDTVQFGHMEAVEPTIRVEEFLKNYRMTQKRRMRSGEIHYLDHPLMGIVIQVRRAPTNES